MTIHTYFFVWEIYTVVLREKPVFAVKLEDLSHVNGEALQKKKGLRKPWKMIQMISDASELYTEYVATRWYRAPGEILFRDEIF